jgi:hypothetical protein
LFKVFRRQLGLAHLLAHGLGFDCGGHHHTSSIRSKKTKNVYAQTVPAAVTVITNCFRGHERCDLI